MYSNDCIQIPQCIVFKCGIIFLYKGKLKERLNLVRGLNLTKSFKLKIRLINKNC